MKSNEDNAPEGDPVEELARGIHFVSGIDTDAGKTICTGWLARELMRTGRTVATMKLVQTGCRSFSPDIRLHRRIMGLKLPEDDTGLTAPALFSYPASPHLAAEIDAKQIDLEHLADCAQRLSETYEVVLVEGAGGLAVPLTRKVLAVDFAAAQDWPIVFVTSGRLGSINHTLLSLEAIERRNAVLSALVFNDFNPMPDICIESDTRIFLREAVHARFPSALWLRCPVFRKREFG